MQINKIVYKSKTRLKGEGVNACFRWNNVESGELETDIFTNTPDLTEEYQGKMSKVYQFNASSLDEHGIPNLTVSQSNEARGVVSKMIYHKKED